MSFGSFNGKMPSAGHVQEIHVCGDDVSNVRIVPIRMFCNDWHLALGDQVNDVDVRLAYLGIVHTGGATLIPLADQTVHINREIAAARAHYESTVSHV